jgi:putative glycosyltransferase (TIGR04372 family)
MKKLKKILLNKLTIKLLKYSDKFSVSFFLLPIYFFFGFFFVLIQIFFSIFKKTNFYYLDTKRIGHFITQSGIFINTDDDNSKNFFCSDKIICNEFLFKKVKEKLFVLNRHFVLPFIIFSDFLNYFFLKKNKINRNYVIDRKHKMEHLEKLNKKPFINFSKFEKNLGNKILNKKFGLKKNDKFICVIVRDEFFLKKLENTINLKNNKMQDTYRNYDLNKFIPAFKLMEKKGYYVFRMGKYSNIKLNVKSNKIIDYVNSKYRSDFMDIYLIKNCKFMISTNTGVDFVAYQFKKKIGYLNLCVGFMNLLRDNIYLPSNFIFKKKRKKLSLKEIFKFNISTNLDKSNFDEKNIKPIHNTKKEIKNFFVEMEKYTNKNSAKITSNNQEKFWNIFKKNFLKTKYGKLVFEKKEFKNKCLISESYLNKNSSWFLK